MRDWKMTTIAECSTILGDGLHGTPKYDENGEYAFINGNNLHNGRIVIKPDTKRVGLSEYEKHKKELTDRTILVSINGTLGNVAVYNGEKVILGKSACYFNVSSDCDVQFMRYVASSPCFQQYINSVATGTTIKNVSLKQMREYSFLIPELEEQQRIAKVLHLLDQKIENNQKINDNLQQQAAALFESWFVNHDPWDGVQPSEWINAPLGSFVEIKRGGSPRPIQDYLSNSGLRWLKISDVTSLNSPFVLEIKEHIKEEGLRKTVFLHAGELVLSNSATPGIPKILDVDTCIHDGWLYFPKSELSKYYLYLFFKHIRKELVALGNGSVFTNLKTDILKTFPATKADGSTLKEFDALVAPLFDAMLNADRENFKLAAMRDALIPKLMSGEIDVSDIQL